MIQPGAASERDETPRITRITDHADHAPSGGKAPVPQPQAGTLGAALWRASGGDRPVIVVGYYDEADPDGTPLAQIAGSDVGVPVDQLEWPRRPIDLNLLRRCIATGNLDGIRTHLAMRAWGSYLDALIEAVTAQQQQRDEQQHAAD